MLTSLLALAAGFAAGVLAAVALRRGLWAHCLVAATAGMLATAVGVAWAIPSVRELAELVPDTVRYALFLLLVLAAAILVPLIHQWLRRRTGSTRGLAREFVSGVESVGMVWMEHGDELWPDPATEVTRPIDLSRWT
jgi:hypothetical protein